MPSFEFDTKEPADLALFAESLPKLVDIGMPIPVQWAMDKLGIPEAQEMSGVRRSAPHKRWGYPQIFRKMTACECGLGAVHALSAQPNGH
nr:DUF935 family protein [Mannheimia haemolytica]